jgi:hypothetical protein
MSRLLWTARIDELQGANTRPTTPYHTTLTLFRITFTFSHISPQVDSVGGSVFCSLDKEGRRMHRAVLHPGLEHDKLVSAKCAENEQILLN